MHLKRAFNKLKNNKMKYLNDYTEKATTKALNKAGAFFAFSDEQFKEEEEKGVKYSAMGMGLICPTNKADELATALKSITENGIKTDIKENGKSGVIARELSNHEACYTGNISETVEALAGYNFTVEEITEVFKIEQAKNNLIN